MICVYKEHFFPFFFIRCFIPNAYAALFTAALMPLMCLVVVFVVFVHAYQVTPQWKAYDDIFRGRTNAAGRIHQLPLSKRSDFQHSADSSPVQKKKKKHQKPQLNKYQSTSIRLSMLVVPLKSVELLS